MSSLMEFLTYGFWLGIPVALAGPSLAVNLLPRWKIAGTFVAAFAPTLAGVLLLIASGHMSWGGQRATPGGEMTNDAALLLLTFGIFAVGVAGLVCGGVVLVASRLWRRRHAPGIA